MGEGPLAESPPPSTAPGPDQIRSPKSTRWGRGLSRGTVGGMLGTRSPGPKALFSLLRTLLPHIPFQAQLECCPLWGATSDPSRRDGSLACAVQAPTPPMASIPQAPSLPPTCPAAARARAAPAAAGPVRSRPAQQPLQRSPKARWFLPHVGAQLPVMVCLSVCLFVWLKISLGKWESLFHLPNDVQPAI